MRNAPECIEVESEELDDVLRRVEQSLDEKDSTLIRRVFESYAYVSDLIDDKNTSIRHLRELFFGKRTEKTAAVVGEKTEVSGAPSECAAAAEPRSDAGAEKTAAPSESDEAASSKGHGRNGADAYGSATRIEVQHPTLAAGDACPACGQGTVYEKAPGVLVRIIGQPPLGATIYELQKLRCHLCGEVFTAPAPDEAGEKKYDATAGSMIGLLKYGSGLPFNRLDGLQGNLEVPLPASTQWDIVRAVAANVAPAFDELIRQAAQGDVLHNDDSVPSKGWHVPWESVPPG
jgi:transposase